MRLTSTLGRTVAPMRRLLILAILGLLGWQGYQHYQSRSIKAAASSEQSAANPVPAALSSPIAPYKCDGRIYCSQMTSCDEATYFLRNCPGVKMDGNNDGVPCEQQWCRR
jgi:Excalibur calcium-binding domain